MSTIHVTMGGSAAASLRIALADAGRDEGVVELFDDLSVGPLRGADDSPDVRAAFWERAIGDIQQDWTAGLGATSRNSRRWRPTRARSSSGTRRASRIS